MKMKKVPPNSSRAHGSLSNLWNAFERGKSGHTLTADECERVAALVVSFPVVQQTIVSIKRFDEQMTNFYNNEKRDEEMSAGEGEAVMGRAVMGREYEFRWEKNIDTKADPGWEETPVKSNSPPKGAPSPATGAVRQPGKKIKARQDPPVPPVYPGEGGGGPLRGDIFGSKPIVRDAPESWRPRFAEAEKAVEKTYMPDQCPFEPYEEVTEALTPSDNEDFDNVREAMKILKSGERTIVFAIAVDKKNEEKNVMSAIRCSGGSAFGGYAHDLSRDAYLVQCVGVMQIGAVPFSLVVTMASVGIWQMKVPIPECVLEKHLTPQQKKMLGEYRSRYQPPQYEVQFIQMLGCH